MYKPNYEMPLHVPQMLHVYISNYVFDNAQ